MGSSGLVLGTKHNIRLVLPFAKLVGTGSATTALQVHAFAAFAAKVVANLLLSLTYLSNASEPFLRDENLTILVPIRMAVGVGRFTEHLDALAGLQTILSSVRPAFRRVFGVPAEVRRGK
jgi:hypothetical protein